MARAFVPAESLRRAASRTGRRVRGWLADHERLKAGSAGAAVSLGAAMLLVPFRLRLGTAAVAAALALVVMLSSLRWGRVAAVTSAVSAGLFYAVFHALPHGLPWVEDLQDLATILVLIGIGLVAASARERLLESERLSTERRYALEWLHLVGERAVAGRSMEELTDGACDAIRAELALESCRLIRTTELDEVPTLEHNGVVVDTAGRPMRARTCRRSASSSPSDSETWSWRDSTARPGTTRVPSGQGCVAAVLVADYLALAIGRTVGGPGPGRPTATRPRERARPQIRPTTPGTVPPRRVRHRHRRRCGAPGAAVLEHRRRTDRSALRVVHVDVRAVPDRPDRGRHGDPLERVRRSGHPGAHPARWARDHDLRQHAGHPRQPEARTAVPTDHPVRDRRRPARGRPHPAQRGSSW